MSTYMNKKAFSKELRELITDRIMEYGPAAFLAGGAGAGLVHLLSEAKALNEENKKKEVDSNVLYIDLPKKEQEEASKYAQEKTATPDAAQYLADLPSYAIAIGGGSITGYAAINYLLKQIRQVKTKEELEQTKKDYSKFLTEKVYDTSDDQKLASDTEFPILNGFASCISDVIEHGKEEADERVSECLLKEAEGEADKKNSTVMSLLTSFPGLAALATGYAAHQYWYSRQKAINDAIKKEEVDDVKKAPATIKIRTADKAKEMNEAPNNLDEDGFESEEGDEDSESERPFFQLKMGSDDYGGSSDAVDKTILNSTGLDMKDVIGATIEATRDKKKKRGKNNKMIFSKNDIERIDDNTVVIKTEEGNVKVDAEDQNAVAALNRMKNVLAKNLAVSNNLGSED